ncbi:NAD(P)-binding domain-containing protein [Bacteroidales bacterium OttesenSCG-928-I21]|nr:NAD(P)-binding domain-containing protein [Bacteroidales bacterium OttesenSCG-928-I21]
MKKKILVSYPQLKTSLKKFENDFELIFPSENPTREEFIRLIADCDGFLSAFNLQVDKEIIDAAKKLKIIANYGVGYNNIDVEYATRKKIVVANTPDPVVEPTAEIAFGLMTAAARRIAECDRKLREGKLRWGTFENLGTSMNDKTLGIVGMGRIGQAIARRGAASCMKIVYYNRTRLPEEIEKKYNAEYLSFDELLAAADYISLNMPLTPETHHLINETAFGKMKNGAILVNTARGPVVDEAALIRNLKNGKLKAAALDVYEHEPKISPELLTMDNVVLSPHNGTATIEGREDMTRFAMQNISRFFEGKKNFACLNPEILG